MTIKRTDIRFKWLQERGFNVLADEHQLSYMQSLWAPVSDVHGVFCEAAAGTGKTTLAVLAGVYEVDNGNYNQLIYVRNAIPLRDQGFLPGDIAEKQSPYMKPLVSAMNSAYVNLYQKWCTPIMGNPYPRVAAITPTYERGATYKRAYVIIDEAQSFDLDELQTIYTRCSDDCKVITVGSLRQNDNKKQRLIAGFTPFEVYMEHFRQYKTAYHTLVTNYRGQFSQHADEVQQTIKRLQTGGTL